MEQRNDIGKIIEERLQDTVKAPTGLKWERVSDSLDKRKRKYRFLFLIWTGIAVTGLVVFGMLLKDTFGNKEKNPMVEINTTAPTLPNDIEMSSQAATMPTTEVTQDDMSHPSLTVPDQEKRKTNDIESGNTKVNSGATPTNTGESNTKEVEDDIATTFTLDSVTTYRYYNHDTQNEIITTNKKAIDSLVERSGFKKDSIN